MTKETFDLVYEQVSLLGKDLSKAEDKMFFVGVKKMPGWADASVQKMTWKILKFKIYSSFMDKTKSMRWKIADWFAPDIHDNCDW